MICSRLSGTFLSACAKALSDPEPASKPITQTAFNIGASFMT
jgi:hypothetical protein